MKAIDLLRLAYSEGACLDGLTWLYVWIEKHPNGTASEFFRDKAKQRKFSHERFSYYENIDKIKEICSDIIICKKNHLCSMMRCNYIDSKGANINFIDWSLCNLLDWSELNFFEKYEIFYSGYKAKGLYLADMFEEDGD